MIFNNPYWTPETKLDLLARWIIIHSIIYYEFNGNVVEDKMFDSNSQQFVRLVDEHPKAFKRSAYYKTMKGFDGNTGFDLLHRLKRFDMEEAKKLHGYAQYVLRQFGGGK